MRFNRQEPIKVGIVGLGYWGPNRLRALMDIPGAEVSHICDLDAERLDRAARRCPSALATDDLEQLLGDQSVDAVVIATPAASHFELTTRCLKAGKHVFVEKPLAASSGEAGTWSSWPKRAGC